MIIVIHKYVKAPYNFSSYKHFQKAVRKQQQFLINKLDFDNV